MVTLQEVEKMNKNEIKERNKQVIKLIDEWRNDPSDFEDETWPIVKDMFKREDTNNNE
jgi:hypothetical protein